MSEGPEDESYSAGGVAPLEIMWGEGFMSPGGAREVGRIVGGVEISGTDVLDIGCGTGGAAITLASEHGAASVTGVDVEQGVLEIAARLVTERGLGNRVRFQRIEPGRLPFDDESFDVVFSKDAIIHVADKELLFSEAFRVLRPGGRLCVGDWLRGEDSALDAAVDEFVTNTGMDFSMQSLAQLGASVGASGFVDIELTDRSDWYRSEVQAELASLVGPLRELSIEQSGLDGHEGRIEFWNLLVEVTSGGILCPGHVRARKASSSSAPD